MQILCVNAEMVNKLGQCVEVIPLSIVSEWELTVTVQLVIAMKL